MKEKLQRFMYGRYGLDSFGKFTIIVSLVLMLLANFVPARLGSVLSLLCWALLIYTYFRMFSRQTYKRACENQTYLAKTAKVRRFFASQKSIMAQRKTHHIYKCPTCKQKIRVPKGKGRIEIRCPKCNTTFIKKS
ncbi:hypothetical protein [Dorea formicigenerans]|uniref:DNA-directed RNA polymerase subunit P n=1 Tax=Dorea formicigenerans TaxID=39486 RepID=A0A412KZE7_9FIRM|nr:hypothetical protein DWX78_00470 [Dorea formicigenerans]